MGLSTALRAARKGKKAFCDNANVNKRADAAEVLFDPREHLPEEIGEIHNHQTDLPRIARDRKLVAQIEARLERLPTHHDLYRRDAREIDFLAAESVHLVVTSPPYWTLKDYNVGEGQLGYIRDYEQFLDELDKVWKICYQALVPGGRIAIRDILMQPSRTAPVAGALFAVNMLVGTDHGGTFTFEELREDLQTAGFADVTVARQDAGMNAVVTARRTATRAS